MGLDMYLYARRHTSEYTDREANAKLRPLADQLLPPDGNMGAIVIERDVAYWRKANMIHAWFVANVQDGNDDCGFYDVSREQLEALRDECRKVIADPAKGKDVLPTKEGFFFGGTDYDEFYIEELENTAEQIDKVLAWIDAEQALTGRAFSGIDLQYHSSW